MYLLVPFIRATSGSFRNYFQVGHYACKRGQSGLYYYIIKGAFINTLVGGWKIRRGQKSFEAPKRGVKKFQTPKRGVKKVSNSQRGGSKKFLTCKDFQKFSGATPLTKTKSLGLLSSMNPSPDKRVCVSSPTPSILQNKFFPLPSS